MAGDNPVFHDWPARALSPFEMHHELRMERHSRCTTKDCAMMRYCWNGLIELGHLHPSEQSDKCDACNGSELAQHQPLGTSA
jgi:hypothetical protein